MKKTISFCISIAIILCLLLNSGCIKLENSLLHDESEISSIKIVSLKYGASKYDERITVGEIENINDFLTDYKKIEYVSKTPPSRSYLFQNQTVIEITYNSGECELISPIGKQIYRRKETGDLSHIFYGSIILDDIQFANLITKYVGKTLIELEYNFLDRNEEISAIEIVRLGESESDYIIPKEQFVIGVVKDVPEFLQKFSQIDCYFNYTQPTKVQDNSVAIKISYNKGHYELISASGQSTSYNEKHSYDGYRYFDEEQFVRLIEEYINK